MTSKELEELYQDLARPASDFMIAYALGDEIYSLMYVGLMETMWIRTAPK